MPSRAVPSGAWSRRSSRWTCCAPPTSARRRGIRSSTWKSASPARRRRKRCSTRRAPRWREDNIGYTDALGIAPLRAAIAGHYREQYGVAVDPEEIVVTTGSSAAFQLAFLAAFEAGDRVALAAPGYPAYRNILSALGLEPVLVEVGPNAHYQPNPELLAEAGDIAGLIVASPANPTGTMIAPAELARLAGWCRDRGIRLVSDEIYHGITYETPAQTARAFGQTRRSSSTRSRNTTA